MLTALKHEKYKIFFKKPILLSGDKHITDANPDNHKGFGYLDDGIEYVIRQLIKSDMVNCVVNTETNNKIFYNPLTEPYLDYCSVKYSGKEIKIKVNPVKMSYTLECEGEPYKASANEHSILKQLLQEEEVMLP